MAIENDKEETENGSGEAVGEFGNISPQEDANQLNGLPTQAKHRHHHHHRFDLLRQTEPVQLQNFPYFSVENRSLWLTVSTNSFCQQRVKDWNPSFNYNSVGKLCLILSAVLVPLGALLFLAGIAAKDFKINYGEECKSPRNYLRLLRRSCVFCSGGHVPTCSKHVTFPVTWKTPVYVYYELDNFYQNNRQLVKSVDFEQLRGKIFNDSDSHYPVPIPPSSSCFPYINDSNGAYYFPCGAMANAMFGDSFILKTEKGNQITLRKHGISFARFKKHKFKNPPHVTPRNYNYKQIFMDNFVRPKDWSMELWDEWWENGGLANEGFINWMTPSAKPKLRKLYAIIDSVPDCPFGGFCKGNYTADIEYSDLGYFIGFDVDSFNGKKSLIFSKVSAIGSRNLFTAFLSLIEGAIVASIGFHMLNVSETTAAAPRRTSVDSQRDADQEITSIYRSSIFELQKNDNI